MSKMPENTGAILPRSDRPQQGQAVIRFPLEAERPTGMQVFVTGHMPDKAERVTPRFPETAIDGVKDTLRTALTETHRTEAIQRVIVSGTAGVDLLAVEWALDNGVGADLYLPYEEASFVEEAVSYGERAERWMGIYNRAKSDQSARIHVPELASQPGQPARKSALDALKTSGQAYVDLNRHMVNQLRPGDKVIAYWDGKGGDAPGGTEDALRQAQQRQHAQITILNAHLENVAPVYPTIQ